MEHLNDDAFAIINKSKQERIAYINQDKWITYPRANEVLEVFEDLMIHPKTERMPNVLLVGSTNGGKTKILKRFVERYPITIDEETGNNIQPIVYVSSPPKPDEKEFITRMLQYLRVPYSKTDGIANKRMQVIRTMRDRKTQMLLIDEFQHLIAGSYNSQRGFLNGIKDLSNELQIPIIAAGIEDAFNAIQVDPQLANRFEVELLDNWKFDTKEQKKEFSRLLKTIEANIPLPKPSGLYKAPLIQSMYHYTEGLIGEVMLLVRKLTKYAVAHDLDCITMEVLEAIQPLPPSQRNQKLKLLK